MVDISSSDIRRIDPTSLMVFLALMRHRKGTVAAKELGLTQPAISHALKRMRDVYSDPLFLRRAHGLEPTAAARELEPLIRDVVDLLKQSLTPAEDFDPSEVAGEFRLGAFDFELATILPALVSRFREFAPELGIYGYQIASEQALEALLDGRVDMVVGYVDATMNTHPSLSRVPLYSERYVAVAREDHPLLASPLSLIAFAEAEHLLVSPSGPKLNIIDHALQLEGLRRSIKIVVPSLFSALAVLGQTDLVASLPERVAAEHAARFGLTYRELPMKGGEFQLHAVTHARDATSPIHRWTFEQIQHVARSMIDSDEIS